jgi:hypothetical protein
MPTMLARQGIFRFVLFRSVPPSFAFSQCREKGGGVLVSHAAFCVHVAREQFIYIVSDQDIAEHDGSVCEDIAGNSSPLQADSGCIAVVSIHR